MLLARDLALELLSGRLSPIDLVARCAETIAARDPEIGAFAALDIAGAEAAAAVPGLAAAPLAGLPLAIKDVIDTRDLPTQYGSDLYAGHRPAADAAVVRQVKRAGGLVIGKSVTTEFAFMQPAGTRNPRRLTHTPGGSSSGSAAAVAAGMVPLALGTQTGGSVIRPAAFCGVTGYKPTFRTLPTVGMKTFSWHLDTLGLFGARVCDVGFAAAALTGRDLDIGDAVAQAPRIAVVRTARAHLAEPASHAALDAAIAAATRAGAVVREIALPDEIEAADAAHPVIQDFEGNLALADEFDLHRDRLSAVLAAYLTRAAAVTPDAYDEARRTAKRARQRLGDLFADYDMLLTFSAPGAAPAGFETTGSPAFNRLWTLMGTPCLNVTGCADAQGLPVGVQIVGRFGRDRAALLSAAFLERALAN
ncbi:amidase [Aquabacter spiritensis]|uniref:Asp-tRNA(Asn)/Glu-tRNA(Gln) amidotransferase A subunit family amidase n=1 Tax=Aquabacter spiritensis TaxID=933073 RepID=A0A4R3LVT5_9HYPH|nr:amidase [Aquabacter spiritensis]TCT02577.1 Asp-tRNA(Asn)/Glu-tRNA(Gln) amidotransferase A subunit family amidase [Aquabacter spiritensis]